MKNIFSKHCTSKVSISFILTLNLISNDFQVKRITAGRQTAWTIDRALREHYYVDSFREPQQVLIN
jgi:hypothetical protein